MKDSKKKNILAGAAGMAAGAAGTIGAQELRDYLNEQEEVSEEVPETETNVSGTHQSGKQEPEKQPEPDTHQTTQVSHLEAGEVVPVVSEVETVELETTDDNLVMIDVDPEEVAQAIVEEAEDPEVLLAMNEEKEEDDEEEDEAECDDEDDGENEDDIDEDDLPDIEESIA